jgi:hypothetical protein
MGVPSLQRRIMRGKHILSLLALAGLALLPVGTFAGQEEGQKKNDKVRTVTGCLQAGEHSDEYTLAGEDGSTWELHSKGANLSSHVGHTVTVTGDVWHPNTHGAKEKAKEETNPNASEHGHLRVTDVQMVSESCKK